MYYKKKQIRNAIFIQFEIERKDSNKSDKDLFDIVKARVVNETSGLPSLLTLGSLMTFLPMYLFLGNDPSIFISIITAITILFALPYYWYETIKNPYCEKDENKEEGLNKTKTEEKL